MRMPILFRQTIVFVFLLTLAVLVVAAGERSEATGRAKLGKVTPSRVAEEWAARFGWYWLILEDDSL